MPKGNCEMAAFFNHLCIVLILMNSATVYSYNVSCDDFLQDLNEKAIKKEEYCADTLCIAKCCLGTKIMYVDKSIRKVPKCVEYNTINQTVDYSKIDIYKSNLLVDGKVKTNKNVATEFRLINNKKMALHACASRVPSQFEPHFILLDNGTLELEMINFHKRFNHNYKMEDFCLEHIVIKSKETVVGPFVIYRRHRILSNNRNNVVLYTILKSTGLLISSIFLLLVLFVYSALRELRNLVGMVIMAYITTQMMTFLFKLIENIGNIARVITSKHCKPLCLCTYYLVLSTFFWMGVMSFDIWWTFRGILNSRPIHRRGELVKFFWYSLYAWGTPLLITIAVTIIDYSDWSHMPDFYRPHFELCFNGSIEISHYLYMPSLALLICDWIFFLMTAFNIWQIRKNLAKFSNEAGNYNSNRIRFGLYLKLSLVMGVSWVFDVVQPPPWLEIIASTYNSLIGVAIFIIFVCKRNILFKLCKRFSIQNKLVEKLLRRTSTHNSSQQGVVRQKSNNSEVSIAL